MTQGDKVKKKMGRPTAYTPEIDNEICRRIMDGESLRKICEDDHLPSRITVFSWLADDEHKDFLNHYEKAREVQADTLADELIEISDDGTNDWMERYNKDGEAIGWMVNGEHVQRSRLRVDTRKWIASKLKPKKYGEKIDMTSDGKKIESVIVLPDNHRDGDNKD